MNIKKPKSHSPIIHDQTERDLILVPPSVLRNKLGSLQGYLKATGAVGSDIALAFIFIIPIFTAEFKSFGKINGATIEGAFYIGSIVMLIKIMYDLYKIHYAPIKSSDEVVDGFLSDKNLQNKENKK